MTVEVVRPGTYRLKDRDDNILTNTCLHSNADSCSAPAQALLARVTRGPIGVLRHAHRYPLFPFAKRVQKGNFFRPSEKAICFPIAT
jgi:hypothetical protein